MQELIKGVRRHRIWCILLTMLLTIVYYVFLQAWWIMYPPSWIPATTEVMRQHENATAHICGIGILPMNNFFGYYLAKVDVDAFTDGEKWILTSFAKDGTCRFQRYCKNGRLMAEGRFHPLLDDRMPLPQIGEVIEARTYNSEGGQMGAVVGGAGMYSFVGCDGVRWNCVVQSCQFTKCDKQ